MEKQKRTANSGKASQKNAQNGCLRNYLKILTTNCTSNNFLFKALLIKI